MSMLVSTIANEEKTLLDNSVRLECIGDLSAISQDTRKALEGCMERTRKGSRMTLILALNYSSRWEITKTIKTIAARAAKGELAPEEITQDYISANLETASYPDPDLLIRTSGEYRLSNYLLWQLAYTELYFTNTLWPDFTKEELYKAIVDYQGRKRSFGKTSEQLKK